ncbi:MAG: class I SAM-dependent methyltransferase [Candidatus Omnitrophica bacterium]|nr:class I SAM-dependent methyltransferase [Candidatus Omnitrophota bacterium]
MADTKEKYISESDGLGSNFEEGLIYKEHLSRYKFCLSYISDKTVLDLGSSRRDGPILLGASAEEVTAMDIQFEDIKYARDNFPKANVKYLAADGISLPFKSANFDVVICLEVIEHISNHDQLLAEIKRVLKPCGISIISTPNKKMVKIYGTQDNPLHVKEIEYEEFKSLLNKYFSKVEFYGQTRGKSVVGIMYTLHLFLRTIDIFNLRRLFSIQFKKGLSEKIARATGAKGQDKIRDTDFIISQKNIKTCRNIIAVCKK